MNGEGVLYEDVLHLLHLQEIEFERGFAAEHGDHDFDLATAFVHVVHLTLLAFERAVGDRDEGSLRDVDLEFRF